MSVTSPLDRLVGSGLEREPPDRAEFDGLVRSGRARLSDAGNPQLALGPDVWRVLAKCHGIRNTGEYEGLLNIDERLLQSLIGATVEVLQALDALPAP